MMLRHITTVVFWTAVSISVLGLFLVYAREESAVLVAPSSIGFNVWSIVRSEHCGFVRSRHLRRAYEPARHFNQAQVLIVLLLTMTLCGFGTYVLLV